jgi:H+/Cl- antiporter ClcA
LAKISKFLMKWVFLSLACGAMAGAIAALFLNALAAVTQLRLDYPLLILGLPFAGLVMTWLHKNTVPFVFITTTLTHLVGGSAGREGAIVQMSALLSEKVGARLALEEDERKILLIAALGAGFSAAIGVPFAGMIFGIESIRDRESVHFQPEHAVLNWSPRLALIAGTSFISAQVAHYSAILFHAHHTQFEIIQVPKFQISFLFWLLLIGVIFGLAASVFTHSIHLIKKLKLSAFSGGIVRLILFSAEGSHRYEGLGVPGIVNSFHNISSWLDPIFKNIFTAITLASGFKGGTFTPLVFIGSTLGSSLASFMPFTVPFLAGLGFAAVFAGTGQVPLACSIMAIELFGPKMGVYALVVCMVSSICVKFSSRLKI